MCNVGGRSPWGRIDHVHHYADGIDSVGTPGHGGLKLSRERNAKVHPAWRRQGGWYEEDVDACIVIVTFPEVFKPETVASARIDMKNSYPDEYGRVFGCQVSESESSELRRRAFKARTREQFVTTSAVGDWYPGVPKGMVAVRALRASDGAKGRFLVPAEEYERRNEYAFVVDTARHQEWDDGGQS